MYNPKTLSRMAELKRQETHRKLAQQRILMDSQPKTPRFLTGILQCIGGMLQRLTAPKTTDSASDSRIREYGTEALSR